MATNNSSLFKFEGIFDVSHMWLSDINICDYIRLLLYSQIIMGVNELGVHIVSMLHI